ncbi:MAG: APC family permease [Candidatus Bathyarchaeia archaeon]|nr:amino acid permease [Candidatus Bathyarchaeota archaeon]
MHKKNENEKSLKREVGWFGAFCMGYADVGADIYVAIGLVAYYAAGAAPLAFLIASITYICTGLAYAELASIYPYAGGAQVYAMKAFNDFVGFIAGWAVMLDYTVDITLFSLASAGYLSFFFPSLKTTYISLNILGNTFNLCYLNLTALILVLMLLLLNIIGIKESSIFNEVLVSLDLIVEVMILIFGFILAFNFYFFLKQIYVFGAPSPLLNVSYVIKGLDVNSQNFIYGVTLAMTSYIGIESIAQAAEETVRPYKWIPRANKLSILSVIVFAVGLSTLSMGVMPWNVLGESREDPMATLAHAIPVIGKFISPIVALTGFVICLVSTNTGVIGVSRVTFSMGRFKLMPEVFYRVHSKFKTPYLTIILFGSIGGLMVFLGDLRVIADLYNFGALLSYMIVNLCLIILRNTEREVYRPWKAPGEFTLKIGKKKLFIPVLGLIGFISCAIIWSLVLIYHKEGRILGTIWLLIGLTLFYLYRKIVVKIPLLSRETGKFIKPSGYMIDALVLIRTPEDYEEISKSINESLDKRFKLNLLTILDPKSFGLSKEHVKDYKELLTLKKDTWIDLQNLAKQLSSLGFECKVKVEVGDMERIIMEEAERHDLVVLIKRKTVREELEKERIDSLYVMLSKQYPGKLTVVRRV